MMTEGSLSLQGHSPDRRTADRQISVLINAGIAHQGRDSLCRIRNLSSGGVMIECNLPLAVDDKVSLLLRSGHELGGCVRWVRDDKAGIAFDEPGSAALINCTGAMAGSTATAPVSPIGYPLFRRHAWCRLAAGYKRERAVVAMISPTGIVVETAQDWGQERLFTVTIDGLGSHMARMGDAVPGDEDGMMTLTFVQPFHYRAFSDWLAGAPPIGEPLPVIPTWAGSPHWV